MPDGQIMTTIVGFNERNMINQALMYRYILSYEPYFFKGRLDDFPLTLAYGKQMDALRTELRDYFWDGEFCDIVGAVVTNLGKLHSPYSLFINHQKTKSGLVICNYHEKDSIVVQAILEDGEKLERYRLVDNPSWQDLKKGISIPPLSSAVVI
jgi:hypothetical protein